MKIKLSNHAKQRNIVRRIALHRIKETIVKPDKVDPSFRGRKLYRKSFGDKILEVIAKKEENTITVITQYYLKRK